MSTFVNEQTYRTHAKKQRHGQIEWHSCLTDTEFLLTLLSDFFLYDLPKPYVLFPLFTLLCAVSVCTTTSVRSVCVTPLSVCSVTLYNDICVKCVYRTAVCRTVCSVCMCVTVSAVSVCVCIGLCLQ